MTETDDCYLKIMENFDRVMILKTIKLRKAEIELWKSLCEMIDNYQMNEYKDLLKITSDSCHKTVVRINECVGYVNECVGFVRDINEGSEKKILMIKGKEI